MGIFWLFLLLCNFDSAVPAETAETDELRISGNYMIVAYFNVHNKSSNGSCGTIQDVAGLQRVEVALQEILTARPTYCKIGILIKDTCDKNEISAHTNESESKVIGIVGPATSEQAESYISSRYSIAWPLKYKYAPHTLYAATSTKVNSARDYRRFVPTDTYQVQAIMSLIRKIGLVHKKRIGVNFIATKDIYGKGGLQNFKDEIDRLKQQKTDDICLNVTMEMDNNKDTDYEQILNETLGITQIIVCFCDGDTLKKLLLASKRMNAAKKFIFIASDRWIEKDDILQDVENEAEGNFVIHINTPGTDLKISQEYPHLKNLNHKWWRERQAIKQKNFQDPKLPFVKQSIGSIISTMLQYYDRQGCNLTKIEEEECHNRQRNDHHIYYSLDLVSREKTKCSRENFDSGDKESNYHQYNIIQLQKKNDSGQIELITVGQWNDKVETWYNDLLKIRKIQINTKCMINCSSGDFVEKQKKNSTANPPSGMMLHDEEHQIPDPVIPISPNRPKMEIRPFCSRNDLPCCWTCEKCQRNNYTKLGSERKCDECNPFDKAFTNKTGCEPKKEILIYWNQWDAVMVISVSVIGIFITLVSAIIYYKHIEAPIVAYSCPQLSLIMFNGMIATYLCTFMLIARPTNYNCGIVKFLTSISLTLIYAPLLAKTNRISRALTVTKLREPQLDEEYFSISFLLKVTVIMIAVEVGMASLVEFRVYDAHLKDLFTNETIYETEVVYYCNMDEGNRLVSRQLTNVFFLIYCCIYGIKTIKLPDNFHETKFIVSTCVTTITVLLTYFSIYTSVFKERSAAISFCLLLSTCALISLVGIIFPKLYIVLWRPKDYEECFTPKLDQPPPPNPESPNEIDMSVWESLGVASRMNSDFNEIPMQEKPLS